MFVDVSALVAMLTSEDDARLLASRLQASQKRLTSPLAALEAGVAIARATGLPIQESEAAVKRFLELMGIQILSLPVQLVPLAAAALARYGRDAGHPAGLGTSEAFAYAAARYYRLPLLHTNPGFAATDIEAA